MEVGTSVEELLTGKLNKDHIRLVQGTTNFSMETADSMLYSAMKTGDIHFVQGRLSNAGPMTEGQALLLRKTREKREEQQFLNWLVQHVHQTALKADKEEGEKQFEYRFMQTRNAEMLQAERDQRAADRKDDVYGGFFDGLGYYHDRFGGTYTDGGYQYPDGSFEGIGGNFINMAAGTMTDNEGKVHKKPKWIDTPEKAREFVEVGQILRARSVERAQVYKALWRGETPTDPETKQFVEMLLEGGPQAKAYIDELDKKAPMFAKKLVERLETIRENGGVIVPVAHKSVADAVSDAVSSATGMPSSRFMGDHSGHKHEDAPAAEYKTGSLMEDESLRKAANERPGGAMDGIRAKMGGPEGTAKYGLAADFIENASKWEMLPNISTSDQIAINGTRYELEKFKKEHPEVDPEMLDGLNKLVEVAEQKGLFGNMSPRAAFRSILRMATFNANKNDKDGDGVPDPVKEYGPKESVVDTALKGAIKETHPEERIKSYSFAQVAPRFGK